ncbi:hypothetical protein LZG04_34425 [Saccharothrix sp. S26]|uniref:hypothetical protein n=1 Tax=Saccharothrix sp. S26 TaxID=2907215 RepID=UPI001F1DD3BA|nr:hypothetical protein [Saccharothrix sp. S26]MCE6999873.1 hypothetical protein [Saccharothrix sp. S26]
MDIEALRTSVTAALEDVERIRTRLHDLLTDLDQSVDAVHLGRQGRWTPEMLAALWENVRHLKGVRALFEITSEHPDQPVTFTALIARSGLPEQQQRNEHARMSRVAADLFGEKRWPIENWQGATPPTGGKAEMMYRMHHTVAAWWAELSK